MAEFFLNLVIFIISLGLLVVIHEFGHYSTAKAFNVCVTEFSIGFGPAIYTKKKDGKETRFSVRCIPLGGYCSIVGESIPEFTEEEYKELSDRDREIVDAYKNVPPERRLEGIAKWKKIIIMAAGVFLNFVLGYVMLLTFYWSTALPTMISNKVTVEKDSIAEQSGWTDEDAIITSKYVVTIDGVSESSKTYSCLEDTTGLYDCVVDLQNNHKPHSLADTCVFTAITDENKEIHIDIAPSAVTENEVTTYSWQKLGISFSYNYEKGMTKVGFFESFAYAGKDFGSYSIAIFQALGSLFTVQGISQVGGVISIFSVQSSVMSYGFTYVIRLWSLISINLGIMNLLPFPGLDGWHILVTIIEGITRKELPKKFKTIMSTIGMILLFGLMIAITIKDIFSLI